MVNMQEIAKTILDEGMFDYGSTISRVEFCRMFGIKPLTEDEASDLSFNEIKSRITEDELNELQAANIIRAGLLNQGKHFERRGDIYRVCLVSENESRAANLFAAGQRKYRKAQTLIQNTPTNAVTPDSHIANKILVAMGSVDRKQNRI